MLSVPPPQRAHSDKKRAWQDILTRHGIQQYAATNCAEYPNHNLQRLKLLAAQG